MVRSLVALLLATSGLAMPALVVADVAAAAASTPRCAGKQVTIDLNKPGHPDPNRARADVVLGTDHFETIETGGGSDTVCAGRGDDVVDLGAGNDAAYGQGGNDHLKGGPGRDHIEGGRHADRVVYRGAPRGVQVDLAITGPQVTGWGRDTIDEVEQVAGGPYDDTLQAAGFGSRLFGNAGNDLLLGTDEDDDLVGGPGDDEMQGGLGDDAFEALGDPSVVGQDIADGGPGEDVFFGATPGDHYEGGDDSDLFYSAECSPCAGPPVELLGGAGNDEFNLAEVDELVDGGDGVDRIDYFALHGSGGPSLTVDLAIVGPQDTVAGGTDDLSAIEDVFGTFSLPNQLSGDDADNRLVGRDDDDVLVGRGGDDVLDGAEGIDSCDGGSGTNQLIDCEP